MEAVDTFIDAFVSTLLTSERWPFWAVAIVFAIVGQVMSKGIFSREQAYMKRRGQAFFWWGRETLPLHPIVAGFLVGLFWVNPEGHNPPWNRAASCFYFALAGAVSLFLWVALKGIAKSRGISLELPGRDSNPPPARGV